MFSPPVSQAPPVEFWRWLPWSLPGDSRAGGVAEVRRVRVKGHDPRRRRERGRGPRRERGGLEEEGGNHLNLNVVRTDSCSGSPELT